MATRFSPKIALVGSGMIGGTVGLLSGLSSLSNNIVFLDVVEGMPAGKALDLAQATTCQDIQCTSTGCSDLSENSEGLKDADIVIVTAGFPRKPGMSRDDLLSKNAEVISNVGRAIGKQCPKAFVICITNPLDVMVSLLQKVSGLPTNRVVGMAGLLDSSRFRYFLAEALKVSVKDVHTMVLGGHGDAMVPVLSATSVNGIPLFTIIEMGMITQKQVDDIVERTRQGGGEIVALLKMGSAFVAPAVCALSMVQAYLRNERRIIPCCAYIDGKYGLKATYGGVPCIIGSNGVEEVLDLKLAGQEKEMFIKSMKDVEDLRANCRKLGFEA
ncbi:malate dehydrogenase [Gregarina niphandrodes]|uniref:L-lactate dehydrogenase n=1 Tax=Gregarina niphandrodes TaxID=110365 RepID=A0A023BD60_GRENI|nr:malate dehydrogenase [Gregarina niphandrodes]EZG87449.1 malate dehydrogenase [Gregarina niphandrodes]|eukprot:XP_011128654.1 malate dehydrogenase [Gregarina niphandrodes]